MVHPETQDKESGNFQVSGKPGHCGIYNFRGDNMWHVHNSGMDNFLKNCADSNRCRIAWIDWDCYHDSKCVSSFIKYSSDRDVIVDAVKTGVDCAIETKDFIEPKAEFEGGECRATLEIQEYGNLEHTDKICLSLTDKYSSEFANVCHRDDIPNGGKYTIRTPWFSAQNFKATIVANNFNTMGTDDNERWYADDLRITCRQCMPECTTTCEVNDDGLINVLHDNTSGHTSHRCYVNDDDECSCECQA